MSPTRALLSGLIELLAPTRCPGCDLPHEASHGIFCAACSLLLEPTPSWLHPPRPAAAALLYVGPLADAVRRLKYAQRTELAPALGALLAQHVGDYAGTVDCVAPLPLHQRKLRSRGYNPAALLARPLAKALGVPIDVGLLARRRPTRTQAGLPRDERLRNVQGAFVARSGMAPSRVLLIDDVRTTGATLAEAASTLSLQGHEVKTLALAWAPS